MYLCVLFHSNVCLSFCLLLVFCLFLLDITLFLFRNSSISFYLSNLTILHSLHCVYVFLSFCLFVFLSFCLFVFLSFCLFVFLSISLSICFSVYLSFCFFWLSVFLFFYFSIFLSICLSVFAVFPSLCFYVFLSFCIPLAWVCSMLCPSNRWNKNWRWQKDQMCLLCQIERIFWRYWNILENSTFKACW
jgi:hypothetical protein